MKRDMDLVRMILKEVADAPPDMMPIMVEFEGEFDSPTVNEHVDMLIKAGYLEGKVLNGNGGRVVDAVIFRLTWQGQDFLDAASEKVWAAAKENILKPGVSFTMDLLLSWMKQEAKSRLGLP